MKTENGAILLWKSNTAQTFLSVLLFCKSSMLFPQMFFPRHSKHEKSCSPGSPWPISKCLSAPLCHIAQHLTTSSVMVMTVLPSNINMTSESASYSILMTAYSQGLGSIHVTHTVDVFVNMIEIICPNTQSSIWTGRWLSCPVGRIPLLAVMAGTTCLNSILRRAAGRDSSEESRSSRMVIQKCHFSCLNSAGCLRNHTRLSYIQHRKLVVRPCTTGLHSSTLC